MSELKDFLKSNVVKDLTEEVIISDRFKDKDGIILKFKIKALSDNDYSELQKSCMKCSKKGVREFDNGRFRRMLVILGTVDPNFEDAVSVKELGLVTPEDYVKAVLLPGEIEALGESILNLSGFKDMEELRQEAKN